jgi:hypothetical protein
VARVAGVLTAYAILRIGHAAYGIRLPGARPEAQSPASAGLTRNHGQSGPNWLGQLCVLFAWLGGGAVLLGLASLIVSVFILNTAVFSVMLTPGLGLNPDIAIPSGMAFSILVGISGSRLIGGNSLDIAFRSLVLGFGCFSMLMVPICWTTDQLSQAIVFRHPIQGNALYRIRFAEETQGKHGISWRAVINPYHLDFAAMPEVPIDQATYTYAKAHSVDAAPWAELAAWGPDRRWQTTNLCLALPFQRAGTSERIIIDRGHVFTMADMEACPVEAR